MNQDNVNSPAHYSTGRIECIDAMKAMLTPDEFEGYLRGNAFKYIWRSPLKGKPIEDLDKAIWYIKRLQQEVVGE